MSKPVFYSVTDVQSIPIAQRDVDGVYFLRTPDGFKISRIADTAGKELVELDLTAKENVSNKTSSANLFSQIDENHYPTTKAVVEKSLLARGDINSSTNIDTDLRLAGMYAIRGAVTPLGTLPADFTSTRYATLQVFSAATASMSQSWQMLTQTDGACWLRMSASNGAWTSWARVVDQAKLNAALAGRFPYQSSYPADLNGIHNLSSEVIDFNSSTLHAPGVGVQGTVFVSAGPLTGIQFAIVNNTGAFVRTNSGYSDPDYGNWEKVATETWASSLLSGKVDKISGKQLSTEDYTTAEKNKLAGLESSHFKGQYTSLTALQSAAVGGVGNYAYVDAGAGSEVQQYIWDDDVQDWVHQAGASVAETPASIKTKYESNPDTNAFTDSDKNKLAGIETGAQVNPTSLPPNGAAGGDLSGSYPNPTIKKNAVTNSKFAVMPGGTVKANINATAHEPDDVSVGTLIGQKIAVVGGSITGDGVETKFAISHSFTSVQHASVMALTQEAGAALASGYWVEIAANDIYIYLITPPAAGISFEVSILIFGTA